MLNKTKIIQVISVKQKKQNKNGSNRKWSVRKKNKKNGPSFTKVLEKNKITKMVQIVSAQPKKMIKVVSIQTKTYEYLKKYI